MKNACIYKINSLSLLHKKKEIINKLKNKIMKTEITIIKYRKEALENAVKEMNTLRREDEKVEIKKIEENEKFLYIEVEYKFESDLFYLGVYFNKNNYR